jgi:hypothetical protein
VDAGDYTCFAENKFGDAKAEGTLTVKGLYFKVLLCVISVGFFKEFLSEEDTLCEFNCNMVSDCHILKTRNSN